MVSSCWKQRTIKWRKNQSSNRNCPFDFLWIFRYV